MTAPPINLTQLRERRYSYWETVRMSDGHLSVVEIDCTDELLTLIDVAEAALEVAANFGLERTDIYTPEHEARDRFRETLARYTTE